MSQENVEVVKRLYDAFNRDDFDAGLALCDSEVVIDRSNSIGPDAQTYRGHPGLEQFWSEWKRAWADTRWEIDECIDNGGNVVVLGRLYARGAASGVSVEANVSQVVVVRGGKVLSSKLFQSRSDALEAAGLPE
jgi:ketosteroid isomerase-like protein